MHFIGLGFDRRADWMGIEVRFEILLLVVGLEVSLGFYRLIGLILGISHIWVSIREVGMIPIVGVESFVVTLPLSTDII